MRLGALCLFLLLVTAGAAEVEVRWLLGPPRAGRPFVVEITPASEPGREPPGTVSLVTRSGFVFWASMVDGGDSVLLSGLAPRDGFAAVVTDDQTERRREEPVAPGRAPRNALLACVLGEVGGASPGLSLLTESHRGPVFRVAAADLDEALPYLDVIVLAAGAADRLDLEQLVALERGVAAGARLILATSEVEQSVRSRLRSDSLLGRELERVAAPIFPLGAGRVLRAEELQSDPGSLRRRRLLSWNPRALEDVVELTSTPAVPRRTRIRLAVLLAALAVAGGAGWRLIRATAATRAAVATMIVMVGGVLVLRFGGPGGDDIWWPRPLATRTVSATLWSVGPAGEPLGAQCVEEVVGVAVRPPREGDSPPLLHVDGGSVGRPEDWRAGRAGAITADLVPAPGRVGLLRSFELRAPEPGAAPIVARRVGEDVQIGNGSALPLGPFLAYERGKPAVRVPQLAPGEVTVVSETSDLAATQGLVEEWSKCVRLPPPDLAPGEMLLVAAGAPAPERIGLSLAGAPRAAIHFWLILVPAR